MELTATLNNNGKNNHTDKLTQIGSTITVIDPHHNTQSTLLQKAEITLSETSNLHRRLSSLQNSASDSI